MGEPNISFYFHFHSKTLKNINTLLSEDILKTTESNMLHVINEQYLPDQTPYRRGA